jgi:putative tryptophan/tyrosine transport system substrate-binding protein
MGERRVAGRRLAATLPADLAGHRGVPSGGDDVGIVQLRRRRRQLNDASINGDRRINHQDERRRHRMRRRNFILLLASALIGPRRVRAQQFERVRRIGVLMPFAENDALDEAFVTAFRQGLSRFGWVEGKNFQIDYRFAAGDPTLFKTYAAELVGLSPDVILAGTTPAVAALRQQTRTIPIVFVLVTDPIAQGFVETLARPAGNITGFTSYNGPMVGKWLQLLKQVAPNVERVAAIFNPGTAFTTTFTSEINAAASSGVAVQLAPVHDDAGIEQVIAAEAREPGGGLIVLPDAFSTSHRDVIVAAAIRHRLPLIGVYSVAKAGGLMSYGLDQVDPWAQSASYIDRILKGAAPRNLPVQQPVKYFLIINLKTAKLLGLTVPPALLAQADEVIE